DSHLAPILETAHQICLVCQQIQAEIELHQQAYFEAVQRELELQQQLTLRLDLVKQYWEPSDLPPVSNREKQQPAVENGRSWWQRLRDRFEQKSSEVVEPSELDEEETREEPIPVPLETALDTSNPTLTVYCLGDFRVYINDNGIDQWRGIKSKSLFKYLVVNRQRPVPIEVLMDTFWQENDPESARRNLYQAIYLLRQTVQSVLSDFPFILSENGCYGLNHLMDIWLDSEMFERCVENGRQLENSGQISKAITTYEMADALYNGDFLVEDPYEEWPTTKREILRQAYRHVLERLSKYHYNSQNWTLCSAYYQRLLAADNCREDAHRGLMRVYYFQGQRHLALRQYHRCVEALQEELDVNPMPETVALHRQIQKNHLHF
ncbi:MAG: BTAD domain-containing putative transcriptional regulator, partial [Anaerolineae bacterium]